MKFGLKRPCPNCPFRKDCLPEWLGEARAREISDSLLDGAPGGCFSCHETTFHDDEGQLQRAEKEQHCVGALVLVRVEAVPNQAHQIAERMGLFDPSSIPDISYSMVFSSGAEFVNHHTRH